MADTYRKPELEKLMHLAEDHLDGHTRCKWLYRNYDFLYFLKEQLINDEIIEPYLKDNSGDPKSPINELLNGLFFSTTPRNSEGSPMIKSAFGLKRILIPTEELAEVCNFYFADFNWMKSQRYHYIIIVMALKNSRRDDWCDRKLWKLPKRDNPFFFKRHGNYWVGTADNLFLDIFNAALFDLVDMNNCVIRWSYVETYGRGSSTPGGRQKNPFCEICNIPSLTISPNTYSKPELKVLMELADDHLDGYKRCKWLYRNKDHFYFENIRLNNDNIMIPYLKDNSGDPKSPINGLLKGLFFSATPENSQGSPMTKSAFGPRRILIPTEVLADDCNFYFADFYCMTSTRYHYITIVMAPKNSRRDDWCDSKLRKIDKRDNPFFFKEQGNYWVGTKDNLLVEIFYTANIDLDDMEDCGMKWSDVETFGRGSSTPGGRPKNPLCRICNIPN